MTKRKPTPALQAALLRQNFEFFHRRAFKTLEPGKKYRPRPYLKVLCDHVERVYAGERLLSFINAPPRLGKSIALTAAHAAWVIAKDPRRRIIIVGYSQDLAFDLLERVRQVMMSDWYQASFLPTVGVIRIKEDKISTAANGSIRATSIQGVMTGMGGDLIIIDDPIKADDALRPERRRKVDEWFRNTASTRLDNPKQGAIMCVMQRLHIDDLSATLEAAGGWHCIKLPLTANEPQSFVLKDGTVIERPVGDVLDPVRYDQDAIEKIIAKQGRHHFAAQYQQAPEADGQTLFDVANFKTWKRAPKKGRVFLSIDTGVKVGTNNDPTVIVVARKYKDRFYLLDVMREKLEWDDLLAVTIHQFNRWKPCTLLIEDKTSGSSLAQTLRRKLNRDAIIAIDPGPSKVDRAMKCADVISDGKVYLPHNAAWRPVFENEFAQFPIGKNDDQVDAVTQLLNYNLKHEYIPEGIPQVHLADDDEYDGGYY